MSREILERLESLRQKAVADDERLTELVDIVRDFVEFQINGTEEERIAQLFTDSLQTLPINDGMPSDAARVILQMYPVGGAKLETGKLLTEQQATSLKPIYASGWDYERNFKGVLSYAGRLNQEVYSYNQYNDSGLFVSVDYGSLSVKDDSGRRGIPTVAFEQYLFEAVKRHLDIYKWLGVQNPIAISLTLQNVQGFIPFVDRLRMITAGLYPIRENELSMDSIIVEDLNANPATVMKPIFDQLWNAMGRTSSPYYNQDGEWREPR